MKFDETYAKYISNTFYRVKELNTSTESIRRTVNDIKYNVSYIYDVSKETDYVNSFILGDFCKIANQNNRVFEEKLDKIIELVEPAKENKYIKEKVLEKLDTLVVDVDQEPTLQLIKELIKDIK
ncbi:hypothetical protein [Staphylococcus phage PT94]